MKMSCFSMQQLPPLALPMAALVAALGLLSPLPAARAAEPERHVQAPAREIPIIDRVDLVVVGGNEGGLAAAWKAATLGARVILLNENTFLGSEVTAKGRFRLSGPDRKSVV